MQRWQRRTLGILALGGGAIGVAATTEVLVRTSGLGNWLICLPVVALYAWGVVCGLFLLEERPGAERSNLHFWIVQIPMFTSPLATWSLSSGFYAGALLQFEPFKLNVNGAVHEVAYLPAESNTGMFGGNSNWRGPIWMPVNGLIIRGLLMLYSFYGDEFTVECPTGSGRQMTLFEVAREIARRLESIFLRDASGRRAVYGGTTKFQQDPAWRDLILFYEYFHGDNGAGLGASHQTGWTGLIARLIDIFARITPAEMLATPADRTFARVVHEQVHGG